MIRSLTILFVSDSTTCISATRAALDSPPASQAPASRDPGGLSEPVLNRLKFVAGVAGNAIGFAALIAGCWLGLQVLQACL